ncbi:MAG: hypothetical protein KGM43_06340 [Planctomycetota bacterium]|nr:hypothetical protein [Planctomycetota bacterium]
MSDEVQRLIVEATGKADVDALKQALDGEVSALDDLLKLYRDGIIDQTMFDTHARAIGESITSTTAKLRAMQPAVEDTTSRVDSFSRSTRHLQVSALAASYAFQDFTGTSGSLSQKLMSIQNNIPGILAGLGASTGLVAALSAVAVVGGLVVSNWSSIQEHFQDTMPIDKARVGMEGLKSELDGAAKRMEELLKQTSLTIPQMEELASVRRKVADAEKRLADETERKRSLDEAMKIPETPDAHSSDLIENLRGLDAEKKQTILEVLKAKAAQDHPEIDAARAGITAAEADRRRQLKELSAFDRVDPRTGERTHTNEYAAADKASAARIAAVRAARDAAGAKADAEASRRFSKLFNKGASEDYDAVRADVRRSPIAERQVGRVLDAISPHAEEALDRGEAADAAATERRKDRESKAAVRHREDRKFAEVTRRELAKMKAGERAVEEALRDEERDKKRQYERNVAKQRADKAHWARRDEARRAAAAIRALADQSVLTATAQEAWLEQLQGKIGPATRRLQQLQERMMRQQQSMDSDTMSFLPNQY